MKAVMSKDGTGVAFQDADIAVPTGAGRREWIGLAIIALPKTHGRELALMGLTEFPNTPSQRADGRHCFSLLAANSTETDDLVLLLSRLLSFAACC